MAEISKQVMIEDFESYVADDALAKAWYSPHGAPVRQTLERRHTGGGRQGLRYAFRTSNEPGRHYAAICRVHFKWDLTGCDAVRFWIKPDGSGHHLTFEFNIADARGRNIHDLWSVLLPYAPGDAQGRWVTVPFGDLQQNTRYADSPDVSPVFKPADVIEVALYAGADNGRFGDGVFCIDQIQGVAAGASPTR